MPSTTIPVPPAPIPMPRPRPRPVPLPAVQHPLHAALVIATADYTDVSLESVMHRGFLYTVRVWFSDDHAEHIPSNQDCFGAAYRHTCHHLSDGVLVAAAYRAFFVVRDQGREYRAVPWAYDRATIERDRQAFVRAREAVEARGYALVKPSGGVA